MVVVGAEDNVGVIDGFMVGIGVGLGEAAVGRGDDGCIVGVGVGKEVGSGVLAMEKACEYPLTELS